MRGVSSVPGAIKGTFSDAWFMPGITNPPTTQPAAAELPGHTVYRVVGVTVKTLPAPFGKLRLAFGDATLPCCSVGKLLLNRT